MAKASFKPSSLDALNFLLADVRGALGPYLNVFLVTQRHWSQTQVGWVTTISGLLGLVAQTPAGGAIDATNRKRGAVVIALAVLAVGAAVVFAAPTFWPVLISNTVMAIVGDIFGPAVAALTLGLYARHQLARRMGRNSAFDHAGNVAIAAAAGAVGYLVSQRAVFLLVPVFALLAIGATLSIPHDAIDQNRARGLDWDGQRPGQGASGYRMLLKLRPLVLFAVCAMLFHFANAPLLPLVGQKLAQSHPEWATAMMSACIIAAQLIMLPVALAVGATADRLGRKPILLIGFAVLPVRALLYTVSDDAWWLIGVQLLDGVGAGIFGAITPLLIADLTKGTGRYNLAQGAVATAPWASGPASADCLLGWSSITSAIRRHSCRWAWQPALRSRRCSWLCPRPPGSPVRTAASRRGPSAPWLMPRPKRRFGTLSMGRRRFRRNIGQHCAGGGIPS